MKIPTRFPLVPVVIHAVGKLPDLFHPPSMGDRVSQLPDHLLGIGGGQKAGIEPICALAQRPQLQPQLKRIVLSDIPRNREFSEVLRVINLKVKGFGLKIQGDRTGSLHLASQIVPYLLHHKFLVIGDLIIHHGTSFKML